MSPKLQNQLFLKYPKILKRNIHGDPDLDDFSIVCGNGWYKILDLLFDSMQDYVDRHYQNSIAPDYVQPVVAQIKEKFGLLRIYYRNGDANIDEMIRIAEELSSNTCEVCGDPGTVLSHNWIQVLCEKHHPKITKDK